MDQTPNHGSFPRECKTLKRHERAALRLIMSGENVRDVATRVNEEFHETLTALAIERLEKSLRGIKYLCWLKERAEMCPTAADAERDTPSRSQPWVGHAYRARALARKVGQNSASNDAPPRTSNVSKA